MAVHKWRVYINPFDDSGSYAGYQDASEDVDISSLGAISQDLDNVDYSIGVYRTANLRITFRNDRGKYSDVDTLTSMFRYKRADSLVKITWSSEEENPKAGFFKAGAVELTQETTVFVGLLNDDSLTMDLDSLKVSFMVLGRESLLSRVTVPDASVTLAGMVATVTIADPGVFDTTFVNGLKVGDPISFSTTGTLPGEITPGTTYYVSAVLNDAQFELSSSLGGSSIATTGTSSGTHTYRKLFGKMISEVIYACLNQAAITAVLTVDPANITVGTDVALDSVATLLNKSVWDALGDLLLLSNSVLSIVGDAIVVSPRTASASVVKTFYGQGSISGPENIQNIKNIRNGMNRVFNYLSWNTSNAVAQDGSSVVKYGSRSKQFSYDYFTKSSKQLSLLNGVLAEFKLPKQEIELYTPLDYSTLAVALLDRVSVDYPPIYITGESEIPICGLAVCGVAVLPDAIWGFTVSSSDAYKVIGREVDPKTALIKFKLRQV